MSITRDVSTNEQDKFVESTSVPGQPAIPVVNPDGSDLSISISASDVQIGAVEIKDATGSQRATVRDLAANDALNVAIVDGSGDQITSFGGGTQYTEGATDTTITGTVAMWEDGSDTVVATSATKPLPVEIIAGAGSGGTAAADDADFTAGTTSGTPAQGVYESTPTSVTDGDLGTVGITSGRRLKTSATIDAALPAGTNAIGKLAANSGIDIGDVDVTSSALPTGASTSAKQDTMIGHLDGVEGLLTTIDADTGTVAGAVSGTEMQVDVVGALPAGTNAIGKLAANSGVDIGDVDVASIAAGDNNIGNVDLASAIPAGTNNIGDVDIFSNTAKDGSGTRYQPLVDSDGHLQIDVLSGGGAGTQYTEDAAAAADPVGGALIMVRNDTLEGVTSTDGDNVAARGTDKGELYVKHADTIAVTQSGTWDEVGINDSGNSITVDGTVAVTGVATEAKQDTQITHLATIAGDTTDIETAVELIDDTVATLGTTTYTETSTKGLVVGAVRRDADTTLADATNEITPLQVDAAGRLKVEVFDGGDSHTIDGSVSVTGTVTVDGSGVTQPVSNAGLTELAAAINSSKVDVNIVSSDVATGGTSAADDADFTDGTTSGTPAMGVYESTPSTVTDGDLGVVGLTESRAMKVQAQANSGVDIGDVTINNATIAVTQSGTWDEVGINDSGNSITVDGTVAVTGVSTLAEQQTQTTHLATIAGDTTSIQTATELIDDTVYADDADWTDNTSKHLLVGGIYQSSPHTVTDGDVSPIQLDANGKVIESNSAAIKTAVETLDNAISGSEMQVDIVSAPTITVTATNLDVQSGGADLATTTQAGAIQTATELIDDAIYVDDADWTADTSKHALVGGVTQVATTANTDGDVTPLTTNAFRELRVAIPESDLATAGTAHVKKYYTNAGAVTDGIVWSPAAGKRWYVTDLIINVSAAATVTFEDDKAGGDEAVMKFELAANSGIAHSFQTPWFSGEDAADLLITTSAGNVYVTAVGYEI